MPKREDERREEKVTRCVIITGLSGAGKSTALKILEDQGFYAIDNLPPALLPQLLQALSHHRAALNRGVAVVIDIRGEGLPKDLSKCISSIRKRGVEVNVLFLDASDDWIVRRYETTRRRHPLGGGVTILEGIARERLKVGSLANVSDLVIDTSSLSPNDLRYAILSALDMNDDPLTIIVSSFGFKNGIPKDCDYLFDVRFLPNPNYVPELRALSGRDVEIQNYLEKVREKRFFMERLESLLEFVVMQYDNTGKKQVHIAIGCTGGRHRSVAIAEELARSFIEKGHKTIVNHRDIDREEM